MKLGFDWPSGFKGDVWTTTTTTMDTRACLYYKITYKLRCANTICVVGRKKIFKTECASYNMNHPVP